LERPDGKDWEEGEEREDRMAGEDCGRSPLGSHRGAILESRLGRRWSRKRCLLESQPAGCWKKQDDTGDRCENSLALVCLDQVIKGMKR